MAALESLVRCSHTLSWLRAVLLLVLVRLVLHADSLPEGEYSGPGRVWISTNKVCRSHLVPHRSTMGQASCVPACSLQGGPAAGEQGEAGGGGAALLWRALPVYRALQQPLGKGAPCLSLLHLPVLPPFPPLAVGSTTLCVGRVCMG